MFSLMSKRAFSLKRGGGGEGEERANVVLQEQSHADIPAPPSPRGADTAAPQFWVPPDSPLTKASSTGSPMPFQEVVVEKSSGPLSAALTQSADRS
jgi:hypothetical protein